MRTQLMLTLVLVSCGQMKPVVDAGPDTSCGLDCDAQRRYGLIIGRCFEYASTGNMKDNPPALGVEVLPLFTLAEANLKVIPVQYSSGGQSKMRDSFIIVNGDLKLVRREFTNGNKSVTYKDGSTISGVKWIDLNVSVGQNNNTTTTAQVTNSAGNSMEEATTYRITTSDPLTSELKTPFMIFDGGIKLSPGETPDHGSDGRRIFVPDVGFVLISSSFSISSGSALPYYLQRIRDLGTADAGAQPCGLGNP
jgi:hypothetical protein